ncbi:hypothetical protein CXF94_23705 [Halomonas sp. Choline-3u-9]|uniref:hypothetical protein n=1 Tax=unclassified Halomonas TaxID=2609666 RepID=UPI0004890F80|nr:MULTISPECIES: hypothetical protein [unclassified Halomonas]NAO98202.1 hypothetical protein [Halomonas sp. MG34]PKH58146.1 hypothetical protein CXF94_23705 [Halomonas sp. Choline-3u-9]
MPTLRRLTLTLLLALLGALPLSVQANDATWQALQEGGLVILMRHPPWLDSFFRGRGDQASITQTAQEQIAAWQGSGNLLLVTYQVNITALMGGGVGSGEMIVVRPMDESLQVVGRLSVSGQ